MCTFNINKLEKQLEFKEKKQKTTRKKRTKKERERGNVIEIGGGREKNENGSTNMKMHLKQTEPARNELTL